VGLVTGILDAFLCLITLLGQAVAWGVMTVCNLVIAGLGAVLPPVIAALPNMPDWPVGSHNWTWLNWALPVSGIVALLGSILTILVAWFGYRIVLNWVKAL
jgi:Mg2+/Co2+ transporter CorB